MVQLAQDLLNHLDVAFIVDTTGSMGTFIDAARQHMVSMMGRLQPIG